MKDISAIIILVAYFWGYMFGQRSKGSCEKQVHLACILLYMPLGSLLYSCAWSWEGGAASEPRGQEKGAFPKGPKFTVERYSNSTK